MEYTTSAWIDVMAFLHNIKEDHITITKVSKDLNISYSHIFNIITNLHKKGLIDKVKVGKRKKIKLSKIGRTVAKHCYGVTENKPR